MRPLLREEDISGQENWGTALKLLPAILSYRVAMSIAMSLLIAAKIAGVVMPMVLKYIIDGLDIDSQTVGYVLVVPVGLLAAYGLLRFTNVFFAELRDAVFSRVAERVIREIGLDVFRHLHNLDLSYHLARKTGAISRDIERGTRGISFLMRFILFSIVPIILEVVLVIGILFYKFDIWFAIIGLASVVIYIVFSIYTTEWRTGFVRESAAMDNKANTRAIDSLLNYETVKYFGNEEHEASQYDTTLRSWEKAKVKNRLSLTLLNSGQALIIACGVTAMMALAAQRVVDGIATLGDLVMVNAFMLQIFIPLGALGFVYREMKGALVDVAKLFDIKELKPKVVDAEDAIDIADYAADIVFENVHFGYHPEREILKGISFSVRRGQTIALVGESGSGKSTIARLLFRFYDVDSGSIKVGGKDIKKVTQHSLRSLIAVVPQDTVLFNDTLYHNIEYGCPGVARGDVEEAVRLAYLENFINQLPDGYDTVVGERGLKLSGGEKQRVAIARALLKKPAIMIFDEATSSLDSVSERTISEAMAHVTQGVTTLLIAHRLATVVNADQILVIDQGKIVEQGNHQTLLDREGHYAHLWTLQKQQQSAANNEE